MDITATETNLTGSDIVQSTGKIALQRTCPPRPSGLGGAL